MDDTPEHHTPEHHTSGHHAPEHHPGEHHPGEHHRVFLVVVDGREEMKVALRFAALRAKNTGGRVALFRNIEPADFHHWAGVGALVEAEARTEAEQVVGELAILVRELSGQIPAIYIRTGPIVRELTTLIEEDPTVSILVLGASSGAGGPGPLVSHLAARGMENLRIPVTIVPDSLSNEALDALT